MAAAAELDTKPPFDVVDATARLIMPKGHGSDDGNWVRDNLVSTREAVRNGRHETVYYPACGYDGVRALVAYDAGHLVLVDAAPESFDKTEEQLGQIGATNVAVSDEANVRRYSFQMDGRDRIVTTIVGDARYSTPNELGLGEVDVYHTYLPTGANQDIGEDEIYFRDKYGSGWRQISYTPEAIAEMEVDPNAPVADPETGRYNPVIPAIPDSLKPRNYTMVAEGGFFALNERSTSWSPILLQIAGLEEVAISRRHPSTVLTGFYPSKEQIAVMSRTGVLVHKLRTVEPEVIAICNDDRNIDFTMDGFAVGELYYLGIDEDTGSTIESVEAHFQEFTENVDELTQRFTKAGVEAGLVQEYKNQTITNYTERIKLLRSQLTDMRSILAIHFDESGQLDCSDSELFAYLDVHMDSQTERLLNGRYPLAWQYACNSTDFNGISFRKVVDEIIEADFSFVK